MAVAYIVEQPLALALALLALASAPAEIRAQNKTQTSNNDDAHREQRLSGNQLETAFPLVARV